MSTAYFADAATAPGVHRGYVEHEEIDLTDEELRRLKGRAVKAVTMDERPQAPAVPSEYQRFLDGGSARNDYAAFLRGEH